MRTRFDALVKDALKLTLDTVSSVSSQHGVDADTQYMDAWCEPNPALAHARPRLGLLGTMTVEPCALEAFHQPPDEEEVFGCLRKQLTWHHALTKKARVNDPASKMVSLPLQWLLSAGRPTKVIEHFQLAALGDPWPVGMYTAVTWLRLRLVVLSELPRTRETLLLRLLGAGVTLRTAMAELMALPPDAWERTTLVPLFIRFRMELPSDPSQRTPEEQEFVMTGQEYIEAFRMEGRVEGRVEGIETVVARQIERRLKRSLAAAERAKLHGHVAALGAENVADLVIDLAPDALAGWLAADTDAG